MFSLIIGSVHLQVAHYDIKVNSVILRRAPPNHCNLVNQEILYFISCTASFRSHCRSAARTWLCRADLNNICATIVASGPNFVPYFESACGGLLQPRNILLAADGTAKISDVGKALCKSAS